MLKPQGSTLEHSIGSCTVTVDTAKQQVEVKWHDDQENNGGDGGGE
jgi:hypothetical protein